MFSLIIAASLPLVPISADDGRLGKRHTFVSPTAQQVLANSVEGQVLCLDRPRNKSICLERAEWSKAVTLANEKGGDDRGWKYSSRVNSGPTKAFGPSSVRSFGH